MQHRHKYEVRFGCDGGGRVALGSWKVLRVGGKDGKDVPRVVSVSHGGCRVWHLKGTALTNFEGLVLKEDWIFDELITCGYSTKTELSEVCRCETCCVVRRNRETRRARKQERRENKKETKSVDVGE